LRAHIPQIVAALAAALSFSAPLYAKPPPAKLPTMAELLTASQITNWRPLDAENTLYLELASGRVVIELAPAFAPRHVANIKTLVREGYFDGLSINRVQDNFVVQWSDPDEKRSIGSAQRTLAEFTRPIGKDLVFTALPDKDGYAPQVGSGGFPAARNSKAGGLARHCYGMLGVGRDTDVNSGGGTELYVVIGHAPRHLDRNITLAGRVVWGMDLLSSLPRGPAPMGVYETRRACRSNRSASPLMYPPQNVRISNCCAPALRSSKHWSNRAAARAVVQGARRTCGVMQRAHRGEDRVRYGRCRVRASASHAVRIRSAV
jgi:peptidylprolyl isomerase